MYHSTISPNLLLIYLKFMQFNTIPLKWVKIYFWFQDDPLKFSAFVVVTMSNLSEENITEWLHQQMGPPHLPLEMAIPLTIIFIVIFISGLLGNIAVCLVITRHRAMHTATNYYLFNLAISDLILLVFGEWAYLL